MKNSKLTIILIFILILVSSFLTMGCVEHGKIISKEGSFWAAGQTASQQRRFKIQIKTYNDPGIEYSAFKKFRLEFKATDQYNPLLDKYLTSLIKDNLVERGFVEDAENPDFIVMGSHQNIFVPDRDPGIKSETGSYSGFVGGEYFHGTYHSGDGLVTAIIKAKRAQRYWVHDFGLVFFNPKTKTAIWIGSARAWVRVDDLRETAPDVIKYVISIYPH
jgi:hypothetical protein